MAASRASRREAGQAAVLAALCLFSMVVFLAFATNTGTLVNERIRIQNAADLASYAGAQTQASKMNDIAFLNNTIMQVATYCRERLTLVTEPRTGFRSWNKVWNQCTPEGPPPFIGGDVWNKPDPLPLPPVLKATPPVHALADYPPNQDTPPEIPRLAPERYGKTDECQAEYDSRADDLINWCEKTMNYYAQIIYDLNDYGAAYYGAPSTTTFSSLLSPRPIFDAVARTATANYPNSSVEMLDYPANSPVHEGKFYQSAVMAQMAGNGTYPGYVKPYERPGGPAMVPLVRYPMKFNYVYLCCSTTKRCGPEQCGTRGNTVIRNVGHHYGEARIAYRVLDTVYSRLPKGLLYMPVRVNGNPAAHDVPLLDNPGSGEDNTYFGGWGAWNEMRAVAVSKPYEGFIGPSEDQFDSYGTNVDEKPLGMWRALNGVFIASPLEDMKEDGVIPYDTYRARIAGFREPLTNDTAKPSMLDVLVQHVTQNPLPGGADPDPSDYSHTSH